MTGNKKLTYLYKQIRSAGLRNSHFHIMLKNVKLISHGMSIFFFFVSTLLYLSTVVSVRGDCSPDPIKDQVAMHSCDHIYHS